MKVKLIKNKCDWREVADAARTTINLDECDNKLKSSYIQKLLISEHSPIRLAKIVWKWEDLKYWVSVHFVRHKIGIEHFISTQRDDRQKYATSQTHTSRDNAPQSSFVMHKCEADAQTIINISRKRLCNCASKETKEAWEAVLNDVVEPVSPELRKCCVKECVYRNGLCPEVYSCGYNKTKEFEKELEEYTKLFRGQVNSKVDITNKGE